MSDWIDSLLSVCTEMHSCHQRVEQKVSSASVLISVIRTRGSCPRDVGTRMLVTLDTCHGTIGGGHLEYQAIGIAHQLLSTASPEIIIERFPLGARVGQCCGGMVYLSFEFIAPVRPDWVKELAKLRITGQPAIMVTCSQTKCRDSSRLIVTEDSCFGVFADSSTQKMVLTRALDLLNGSEQMRILGEGAMVYEKVGSPALQIAVFGAGHVGRALVSILSGLPCQILWFDSREEQFPEGLPDNVYATVIDHAEHEVDSLRAGAHVVVMTHSHALDQAICERMLQRDDLAWCGLIGSVTKRRQFEKRLLTCGVSNAALKRLVCPIGVDGIAGKHPTEIAIAVAAQILGTSESNQREAVSDQEKAESCGYGTVSHI